MRGRLWAVSVQQSGANTGAHSTKRQADLKWFGAAHTEDGRKLELDSKREGWVRG